MLMIGRHHSLPIIQARSLSNNPKYCCLLLLHPISNQVTPTQVPSTSPASTSPLPLHLISIISHVDCTLISFILPQTGLCVTCPSRFLSCFLALPKVNYWHMWIILRDCTLSSVLRQIGFDVCFIYSWSVLSEDAFQAVLPSLMKQITTSGV